MIKIAILDDNKMALKIIRRYIQTKMKVENEIVEYLNPRALISELEGNSSFDIIVSDIQMDNMDGIQLGKLVQRKYPEIYLIYLTSFSEYAAESYMINAYQYILKSDMESRLICVLNELVEKIHSEKSQYRIIIKINESYKLYYRDIIYIRKIKGSKYVEYITTKKNVRERISLTELQKSFDSMFVLVERGFLINIRHIDSIKGQLIKLSNGDEVSVSRSRMSEIRQIIHKNWTR